MFITLKPMKRNHVQPQTKTERKLYLPMDVYEEKEMLVVEVQFPKLDQKSLDLSVEEGILTISGERLQDGNEKEGRKYLRRELEWEGRLTRRLHLPYRVHEDKATARYNNGLLTVVFPKYKGRKIKIQTQ